MKSEKLNIVFFIFIFVFDLMVDTYLQNTYDKGEYSNSDLNLRIHIKCYRNQTTNYAVRPGCTKSFFFLTQCDDVQSSFIIFYTLNHI